MHEETIDAMNSELEAEKARKDTERKSRRGPYVRSMNWNLRSIIREKYYKANEPVKENLVTLILKCSDAEIFKDFQTDLPIDEEPDNRNDHHTLIGAIDFVAGGAIEEAVAEEARCWAEDHNVMCVVYGETGGDVGDDDYQRWNVKCFLDHDRANNFANYLNEKLGMMGLDKDGANTESIVDISGIAVRLDGDPHFRVDGGTTYLVEEVPLDNTPEDWSEHTETC